MNDKFKKVMILAGCLLALLGTGACSLFFDMSGIGK